MARPAVIAHRGFAGIAPENTVAAIERAAEDDETAMIEIDVLETAHEEASGHRLDGDELGPVRPARGRWGRRHHRRLPRTGPGLESPVMW